MSESDFNEWAAFMLSDGTFKDWKKCLQDLEGETTNE